MTIWNSEERAGLGNTAGYVQKLISVPFDKENPDEGNFDLYYFMADFPLPHKKNPEERKTLLFCSGGPGRVVKPHDSLWFKDLSLNGDNVVFFHLRGSGFSQLPGSNKSDKYIRTRYAADDIEAIRQDFFKDTPEKKWDAVLGYSYGAVLAQQYASKYKNSLKKLILIGPISLERFNTAESYRKAYDEYANAARNVRRTIIAKIYELSQFETMTDQQRTTIKEKLFGTDRPLGDSSNFEELGIIRAIEQSFGSEQAVAEDYKFFKNKGILKHNNLAFEPRFFEALRELDLYGWRTDNDGAVNQEEKLTEIGKIIACALISDLPETLRADEKAKEAAIPRTNAPRSRRVFEVMSVYDGTSKRFMRESAAGQTENFDEAINKASGAAFGKLSEEIHIAKKIGKEEEDIKGIKPWSPRDHKHRKSTLIIAGTADPVTAGGQARTFLGEGLVGKKSILLEFEGVGHEFIIPAVNISAHAVSAELRGINADTLNCLVDAFVDKPFEVFRDAAKTIADRLLTEEQMGVHRLGDTSGAGLSPRSRRRRSVGRHRPPAAVSR
jgi:pimeloyl-ACP methyl ester carboxylesterase